MSAPEFPSVLDAAKWARDRGWRPFPVDHPDLESCAGSHGRRGCPTPERGGAKRGKHPTGHWPTMTASEQADATLALWFGGERRNIGIACKGSGLVVLDEDRPGALRELCEAYGRKLPRTYRVKTGKGWHYYYSDPDGQFTNSSALADWGVDVRGSRNESGQGDGGYVIASGSVHVSGAVYAAEDPHAEVVPLPDWVGELISAPRSTRDDRPAREPGEPIVVNEATARRLYAEEMERVRTTTGDAHRHAQYNAWLYGYQMVHADGLDFTEAELVADMTAAIAEVWGAEPNADDEQHREDGEADALEKPIRTHVPPAPDWAREVWTVDGDFLGLLPAYPGGPCVVKTGQGAPEGEATEGAGQDAPSPGGLVIQRLSALAAEVDAEGEPTWLIRGLWPAGDYGVHAAESKAQKTWNAADLAVSVAAGRPWLGAFPIDTTGPVLMFVGEGGRRNIVRRLRAIGRSRGIADPDVLPIDICARAPHLSNDVHMAVIDDHVRTVRPALVVLDPLYLAAKGGNLADLYAMGDLLERAQRVCQDNGAALLVVHHFNRKHGAGRDRMSGAGPAEWGRVLITGVVKGRRTDDATKRTDVTTVLTVVGGEVPDQAVEIQRAVWAEDPDALGSPMHYEVAATVLGEVALGDDMTPIERERHWNDPGQGRLPDDIVAYSGVGQGAIADVARFLRARADGGVGVTMAEMRKALRSALVHPESRKPRHSDDTMDRAWGALSEMKRIVPVDGATGAGRSLWQRRPGDPEWI